MKTLHTAGLIAALGLFAGAASLPAVSSGMGSKPQAGPGSDQCFRVADIRNFNVTASGKLNMRANVSDYYQFELAPNCQGLNFEQQVSLRSRSVNPYACEARELEVLTSPASGGRCDVLAFHKMTPEEVAAIPSKEKP